MSRPECIRSLGQKVERTERVSGEGLRAHQSALLAKLLAHARETTDFYQDRLHPFDLGFPASIERTWREIPILSRAEAVANKERLKSRRTPPEAGRIVELQTSGSTGMPFRFRKTAEADQMDRVLTERMFRWW